MLANRPILVGAVFLVQLLSVLRKRLIIGRFQIFSVIRCTHARGGFAEADQNGSDRRIGLT